MGHVVTGNEKAVWPTCAGKERTLLPVQSPGDYCTGPAHMPEPPTSSLGAFSQLWRETQGSPDTWQTPLTGKTETNAKEALRTELGEKRHAGSRRNIKKVLLLISGWSCRIPERAGCCDKEQAQRGRGPDNGGCDNRTFIFCGGVCR